jgi:hypothetical protein
MNGRAVSFEGRATGPLESEHGNPIGVRFAYRVSFPLGLSSLGQRRARATAHAYRLADFYEGAKADGAVECP